MKELSEKRGKRAAKVFSKLSDAEFDAVLAAITKEEAHRTDPATFTQGGRDDFFKLCLKAVTAGKTDPTDPSHDLQDWELSTFIDDLWNATMGSRRLQEYKPCW
jgi:hypothetical protein